MKKLMMAMVCLAGGSIFASVPVVNADSVSMSQESGGKVTIRYRLSGEPGVVTIDIQTNCVSDAGTTWTSIGGKNQTHMFGDDIIGGVVKYCREHISDEHRLGFLMAPWRDCATRGFPYEKNMQAVDLFADALA